MARKRFNNEVLVKLLDYCDATGQRLGQALINITRMSFPWELAGTDVHLSPGGDTLVMLLFQVENESLEKLILAHIESETNRQVPAVEPKKIPLDLPDEEPDSQTRWRRRWAEKHL